MTKRMRELQAAIQAEQDKAKGFLAEGEGRDLDKAQAALDKADELQKEFDIEARLEKAGKAEVPDKVAEGQEKQKERDSIADFAKAARSGFYISREDRIKQLNEGSDAEGGYTVPEDISTRIETYREAKFSLLNLVRVEKVRTNKGARTFKKRAQQTGFAKVGEGGAIGGKNTPLFERISYEIEKYAGYFPVTNEVLADTDTNLAQTLIEWIGDESRVTANKLILAAINSKEQVDVADLDGIKRALNVTLGQAFKPSSAIVTNDDGLQYLDTLKDGEGRYLLSPMPNDTMQMRLQVGGTFVPVKVIPNDDLPSAGEYEGSKDTTVKAGKTYYTRDGAGTTASPYVYTAVAAPAGNPSTSNYYEATGYKVPMIIGDLREGVTYWDRQQMTIKVSDVAVVGSGDTQLNAFEDDLILYRAIEREDVTTRDTDAFVNGYITV